MKLNLQTLPILVGCWLLALSLQAQTPVANYTFAGNAKDVSATGNTASVHGAILTQDRFGWANNAFEFDGTQSYLEAPNNAALNTNYTTVAFWVKVNALPASGEAFLLSFGGWQERWKISLPDHGKLVWTTNNSSGISDMDAGGGNELTTGVWKHVAFVHDGTNDLIYINGVQIAQKAVSGTMNSTTKPLGIGYNPIDVGNYFNGDLDEIQIFGTALTAGQIMALYTAQNTAPTVTPGIVASYSFSKNTLDATPFANHATASDVTPTTDRFGFGNSAYEFNGTSSEITAANSAQLNSPYTTVSFWVKPNSLPATGEAFLLSFGGWQERFKISVPSHGKVVWTTNNSSGISDMDAGDGNELVVGKWTNVVAVHDGTNDKIFINGVLANSKAVSGTMNSTTYPLGIGYNAVDGGSWFDGVLDEIQIANVALTDIQVAAAYAAQTTFPGTPTTLVANYSLNGNGIDATQFANNAILDASAVAVPNRHGWGGNALQGAATAANSVALQSDYTTINFWVKPDAFPTSGEAFILSNGGWQERWKISLPNHGKPVFTTHSGGVCCSDMDSGTPLTIGTWTMVTMVHDGTNDKIYFNGAEVANKATAGALDKTKYPLGIGYDPIDNGSFFDGSLDDIQIYNVALSAAEITALFAAQNPVPTVGGDLIADYPFSGNANDATDYHNDANASGAQLTTDRFGRANKAYAFNGVSDGLQASNSPQQNSANTTISFWVNPAEFPASGEVFLLSNGGWQERWKISLPNHGKPVFTTHAGGACCSDMDSGTPLTIGTWTMVTMTHDGTNDKIYFNGVEVATKAVTGALDATTYPLGIGYDPIDNGSYFKGSMDEVQIYKVALSAAEVAALYLAQSTPPAVTDTEAPTAPLNLAATVFFNNVNLSWLAASDNVGVTGYNVYQDGDKVLTTANTSADLLALTPLTQFEFAVSAVDEEGNESLWSSLFVTTGPDQTPDVTPPTAPGNLSATTGSHSVLLSWDASTDDVIVAGYVVSVDGVYFDSLPGTATSVLVNGLDAETDYTFEIYAFDLAGNNSTISEITVGTDAEIATSEPGLVAWYKFDGNANDATPYANHGIAGGNPTYIPVTHPNGTGNQAIKFDGMQDSVLAPNAVQLISDYATISFWIRPDAVSTDAEAYVIDFGHWSQRCKISLPQHQKIVWTTNSHNAVSDNFIHDMDSKDGNELVVGNWWYVTMVHDGTNDIIYLDGEEVNNLPAAGTLNSTSYPLGMGNNPIEGGQYFNGALDEVKFYNKALTPAEVSNLFNAGTTTGTEELSAYLGSVVKAVYPNPTTSELLVKHSFNNLQPLLVRVFDVEGRQVGDLRFEKGELSSGQFNVDVSKYATGSYFLNFVLGGKNLGSVKFDKQ
ncbi:MAG: T9SS type A sorting domain-containing protein [Bacteroidetes bacterium]|nr:T9SS type A sorting domain-containing protein [Bacteroidota bacterium]